MIQAPFDLKITATALILTFFTSNVLVFVTLATAVVLSACLCCPLLVADILFLILLVLRLASLLTTLISVVFHITSFRKGIAGKMMPQYAS